MSNYSIETKCTHSGYEPGNGEPRIAPIVQSTTYKYDSADEVAALFDLAQAGHMYTRISNPTSAVLEGKLAELEGGVGALAVSSGQAATLTAIITICNEGEHLIAMNNLYGGTYNLINSTLKKFGIECTFVDINATDDEINSAFKENTKLVFGETIGNPGVEVLDIERLALIAHSHGVPLIIDNTFATPVLCRPIEWGADIVTHSATKYLDGHATSVGGIIVDSGKFNWNNGKFPHLTEKDPNYHGLSYTEAFKEAAFISKARVVFLRDMGQTISPFNAWLINLGCETLALRLERHSSNALKVAKFLENHPNVDWVSYPKLESSPSYTLAEKYLPSGGSGIIAFGVKGGLEESKKFIDSVKLASLVVHVADVRTHVLHPATMTHRQMSREEQEKAGIKENMVRLSVGIENAEDIIKDLDDALRA